MTETFRRYVCAGCNLIFTTDLQEDEIRHCPLCAHSRPKPVDENELVLCVDCCEIIATVDAIHCGKCNKALCDVCGHVGDSCEDCRNRDDDLHDRPGLAKVM
jgi:hypothetical protein